MKRWKKVNNYIGKSQVMTVKEIKDTGWLLEKDEVTVFYLNQIRMKRNLLLEQK